MLNSVKSSKVKSILAIIVMALVSVGMFFWMTYEKDLLSKPVIVAKADIPLGTVITNPEDFFIVKKMAEEDIVKGALTPNDLPAIRGMALKQFIPQNDQVISFYFADPGIVVSGDEIVFKVPSSWIYAVPSSIRRGDHIKFYEVDANLEKNIGVAIGKSQDGGLSTYSSEVKMGSKAPILESTVLYVKDSSNREVVDAEGPARYDGTSQVSSLEIACTDAEMQILLEKVREGMKFIVVY